MKTINYYIEDYLEYCAKVRDMSKVTIRSKRYILERFIRETNLKTLRGLSNSTFDTYISKMAENGASGSSINSYSAAILAFVKYCRNLELKVPLKITLIRKQNEIRTERKFYTKDDIEKVLLSTDLQTGLMIRIMFETGIRIGEFTRLKVSNFNGQQICFIGKGRKWREVYISEKTFLILQGYIQEYEVKDSLWGQTLNNEPPTENTIRKKLKKAFLDAGFSDFYPHALRHSFATNLQLSGASVAEIKEMMGHSNISTTEKYLHGFSGKMEELFKKYSKIK